MSGCPVLKSGSVGVGDRLSPGGAVTVQIAGVDAR